MPNGSGRHMADRLLRRREGHQISYVTVNAVVEEKPTRVLEPLRDLTGQPERSAT